MFESDTQDTFNTPPGYGRRYPASQQYDVRAVPMRTSNSLGEDVDMMDADEELPVANAPNAINERAITSYIVLDTNIFDHNLDLLRPFVDEVEQLHSALPVTFIVPGIVIRELDGQQKRRDAPSLSRAAAAASRWLASSGKGPTLIREQREAETVRESGNWRKGWAVGEINDDSIIDCCKYFRDKLGADVVLWTEDNLLKFRTESANEAIRILKRPADVSERNWSCQAIVRALGTLYGSEALASYAAHFSNDQRVSRAASQRHGFDAMTPSGSNFVDYMEVDWVVSVDPRDSLQMDMIERLGGFVREVLLRVAPANVLSRAPAASIYALPFERRSFANWTLSDQVQYFGPAGRKWLTKGDADHLTQFLLMTSEKCEYSGIGRGKPGNTWTASQWRGAMRSLREIGKRANRESEYVGLANYLDDVRAAASAFNIALDTDEGDQ